MEEIWIRTFGVLLFAGLAYVFWQQPASAKARTMRQADFAKRQLVTLTPWMSAQFDEIMKRRMRGGALITGLGAVAFMFIPIDLNEGPAGIYPITIVGTLGAISVALVQIFDFARPFPQATGHRTARLREVTVSDYVSPVRIWFNRFSVLALLTVCGLLISTRLARTWQGSDLLWWGLVACVALVVAEMAVCSYVARRIVAMPEPAEDATSLYFQDALRSDSLTNVYSRAVGAAPVLIIAIAGAVSLHAQASRDAWQPLISGCFLMAMLLLVSDLIVTLATQRAGRPRVRRTLWSDLAPGQLLMSGSATQGQAAAS